MVLWFLGVPAGLLALLLVVVLLYVSMAPQFGDNPQGERLARMEQSPNFSDGRFQNPVPTEMMSSSGAWFDSMIDFFRGSKDRQPSRSLDVVTVDPVSIGQATEGLKVTWLGHSSVMIETNGMVLLIDPIFSERASPVGFAGPRRFNDANPIEAAVFSEVDMVILSHDHWDHLEYDAILELKDKTKLFVMPLGVGARLEGWGVAPEKIVELDWWEATRREELTLTAVPTRHFSGRALADRDKTLWAGWVIESGENRIYFGGDSGYFDGFKTIGEKFGPFRLTMLESGAYSKYWPSIHMLPEETVRAHLDLRGEILLPIHWGKFNLSLHPWTEPIERLLVFARAQDVEVATPRIGEGFVLGEQVPRDSWWEGY